MRQDGELIYEEIMQQWDEWRHYIANGGGGSWPRDAFEAILQYLQDQYNFRIPEK